MAWVILLLVLLAAAFGILGAVIKAAAFLVLTILLTVAALVAIAWYGFKRQVRKWEQQGGQGGTQVRTWTWERRPEGPRDLPSSHDDRF
jgi:hypothetical protein